MNESANRFFMETFPVGHLQCNCTIVGDRQTQKAMIFDPGGDAQRILQVIQRENLNVIGAYHTHAHFDHFLAAGEIKSATECPLYLHQEDQFLWDMLDAQCQTFGFQYDKQPTPDGYFKDGDALPCCDGHVIHTPGHTPGSSCFWFESAKLLLAGDTLFQRSIGRTDLWGGDLETILNSIRHKLFTLDDDALVITGHGPSTILGEEKAENQFLK